MKSRNLSRIGSFAWFVLIFFQGHFCTNGVWAFDHKGPKIARCPFTATHYFRKRKFYLTIKVWLKQEKKSLFSLEKMLNYFFGISVHKKSVRDSNWFGKRSTILQLFRSTCYANCPSFHKLSRTVTQWNEVRDMNTIILIFTRPSTCLKYVYGILLCYSKNNTDGPILITKKRPRSFFKTLLIERLRFTFTAYGKRQT